MNARIAVLPGDGIGPEVVGAAVRLLEQFGERCGHSFVFEEALIGGCALDQTGDPLPPDTIRSCEEADAILLGAVGGPRWSDPTAPIRPEQGLLRLRRTLGLFANLRPVRVFEGLDGASPLRNDVLAGVDLMIVRELTGGIYFGARQEATADAQVAFDTLEYSAAEVERIAQVGFQLARFRKGRLISVDKANVLASSRLWRQVVSRVSEQYPDVALEHMLVDAAAMHLLRDPQRFDVIITGNMFGDILADEASMLSGSMGLLPSASLGEMHASASQTRCFGLYEPIHGSAPDIAGRGTANPLAMILCVAMMFRHSLGLATEATWIEVAVRHAISDGVRTPDLAGGGPSIGTEEMTQAVMDRLERDSYQATQRKEASAHAK